MTAGGKVAYGSLLLEEEWKKERKKRDGHGEQDILVRWGWVGLGWVRKKEREGGRKQEWQKERKQASKKREEQESQKGEIWVRLG